MPPEKPQTTSLSGFSQTLAAAKAGSQEAFSEIYSRCFKPVFRFLASRAPSREEAEDLTQVVFLKAWNALRDNRVTEQVPLAYLYTLARNTLIDHWRKKRPEQLDEELGAVFPDQRPLASDTLAITQEAEPIMVAIRALPEEQRQVLMHRFFEGLSAAEIAQIIGKSEVAVRQIQCRAVKAVRKAIESEQTKELAKEKETSF